MKNLNLEKEIINCIVGYIKSKTMAQVLEEISPSDFIGEKEKHIFNTFVNYFKTGEENWLQDAYAELVKEKPCTILEYTARDNFTVANNIIFYARELKEKNKKIKMSKILQESNNKLPQKNTNDFILDLQKELAQIFENKKENSDIKNVVKEFEKLQEVYSEKIINGNKIIGIPTLFQKIDDVIDGLRPEHIWILGGYAGSGKTFFALNIIANLVEQKKRTVFYSLEMSKVDIFARLLGIMTSQNGMAILKGFSKNTDLIKETKEKIIESKMSVITDCNHIDEIKISMLQETMKNKVDLFVIDYLQIIQSSKQDNYVAISSNIIELQSFAKKIKTPIIILSQLSNEHAKTRNDRVMGFKGAGDIGAVADFAVELQKNDDDEDFNEKLNLGLDIGITLKIKKNRHGNVGSIDFNFNGKTGIYKQNETNTRTN